MEYFSDLKAKLIYVFRIPDAAHADCVKVGEATFDDGDITVPPNSSVLNKAAKARIDQYTKTAGAGWKEFREKTLHSRSAYEISLISVSRCG